ncbi:MAG TPA: acyloxyacyl hydrolase [Pyrinomonadaceae bacterium]|nr:acyloxyacyl hydrolase [Pyrinomonadaceae bacterium]
MLFTNKAIPVPRSKPFNLTGDFGGGLMYMLSAKRAVNFGYKYFHISNGNIGGKINNPGFNANVFYVNYSFFWK